jgi:putative phosphoribosyl transferase
MWRRFRNRREAGRVLASLLERYASRDDVLVLALPRGGVPVAYEAAHHLHVPLDVFVVRKLGVPGHEELAMGALASGGMRVLNERVIADARVSAEDVAAVTTREARELERREQALRGDRPRHQVRDKIVILVDDGLATGATMRVAARALREEGVGRIVVAIPVAPAETCDDLRAEVDDVICATTPEIFLAVGQAYDDFSETSDAEVRTLLERAASAGDRAA